MIIRQRGISQIEVIVVLVLFAAAAAGAWWLEAHGERVGEARARLEAAQQDNEELLKARKDLAAMQAEVDLRELEHQAEQARIDTEGQRKLGEVERAKDTFVSDVVAGRIRLFNPDQGRSCPGEATAGAPRPGPGVDHGAGGGELQRATALEIFLVGEAARSDKVVVKLTACQLELVADRKACNAPEGR